MKLFQKITALFVMFAFFASTAGISFYMHTCGCSAKSEINFVKKIEDCCSDSGSASGNESKNIKKSSCCKEQFFFYKLPVTFVQTFASFSISDSDFLFIDIFSSETIDARKYIELLAGNNNNPPPLFFGRYLVQFLHSFKIPSSVL